MSFPQRLQRIDIIVSTDGTQALVDEQGDHRVFRFQAFNSLGKERINRRAERLGETIRWTRLSGEVTLS